MVPDPTDLSNLSNLVKNDVDKKTVYYKLVAKVDDIDTNDFVYKLNMTQLNQNRKIKLLM